MNFFVVLLEGLSRAGCYLIRFIFTIITIIDVPWLVIQLMKPTIQLAYIQLQFEVAIKIKLLLSFKELANLFSKMDVCSAHLDGVFGCDLAKLVEAEGGVVPQFLIKCMKEVEQRGKVNIILYIYMNVRAYHTNYHTIKLCIAMVQWRPGST